MSARTGQHESRGENCHRIDDGAALGDGVILAAMGLLLGFLGPFDSDSTPIWTRYTYWTICMLGGGLIAVALDERLGRRLPALWKRVAAISTLATPLVALFVLTTQCLLFGERFRWPAYLQLLWQVLPIMLAAMAVRALAWRRPPARVESRTIIAPPERRLGLAAPPP